MYPSLDLVDERWRHKIIEVISYLEVQGLQTLHHVWIVSLEIQTSGTIVQEANHWKSNDILTLHLIPDNLP